MQFELWDALPCVDGTCLERPRKNARRCNNIGGVVGVNRRKKGRRCRASVCFGGKRPGIGRYERLGDAVEARKKAKAEMHGALIAPMMAAKSAE